MEATIMSILLLLLLLLILISFFLRKYLKFSDRHNLPETYPVIGCLVSFYTNRDRLLDWYTELLAKSSSRTIVIRRLGARRTIVTADPYNVEYILRTNFENYPKGKPFTEVLGDFLGTGIFNVDGTLWSKQRKLASHEFTLKSLKDYVIFSLEDEVDNHLLPFLDSLADKEKSNPAGVDLQELFRRLAFNLICIVFLGIDRCSLDSGSPISPIDRAFQIASGICAKRGSSPLFIVWKIKKWARFGSEKKLKRAVEEVHKCVDEIIRVKKMNIMCKNVKNQEDFLTRLILTGQDDQFVRDMVINLVMAGRDTTSAVMTWFFWLISGHTGTEQELVKEIRSVKKKSKRFDFESLKELKLLKASLCEVMRLYPPVPWDSKHALTKDRLPDGTLVQAEDRVTYFPYGMGRMEEIWGKDWDEFKPDRWFTEPDGSGENYKTRELKEVCPFKFPVFQAGPRVCLGKEMAFAQMKYAVASVLDRFEIKPIGSDKPVFVPLLTGHMAGGLKVYVRRRDRSRSIG